MLSDQFIQKLRCPQTTSPLHLLTEAELTQVNRAAEVGKLVNQVGLPAERPLQAGLRNDDRSLIYPVWDDIPTLIPEEAFPWNLEAE
ncbi:MAG: hypothetical protein KDA60_03800 [Planctomycetales bacterium]|nr:hypothetical protein [Planctomycetales bacterium]